MKISLNGELTEMPQGIGLSRVLDERGYRRELIAVELNLAIVPRDQYDSVSLEEGDELEIVSFMGGG